MEADGNHAHPRFQKTQTMTIQRIKESARGNGLRLTTLVGVATLLGLCVGGLYKMTPFLTMPEKMEWVVKATVETQKTQAEIKTAPTITTHIGPKSVSK